MEKLAGRVFFRESHAGPEEALQFEGTEEALREELFALAAEAECLCCLPAFRQHTEAGTVKGNLFEEEGELQFELFLARK